MKEHASELQTLNCKGISIQNGCSPIIDNLENKIKGLGEGKTDKLVEEMKNLCKKDL